jgi:hypothetical protein
MSAPARPFTRAADPRAANRLWRAQNDGRGASDLLVGGLLRPDEMQVRIDSKQLTATPLALPGAR